MNHKLAVLRYLMIIVVLSTLSVLISCTRDVVQPIPDIQIDTDDAIDEPDPLEPVDPSSITGDDISLSPGELDFSGTTSFSPLSDPQGAIDDANALNNLLNNTEEQFWDQITTQEIENRIESGNTQFLASLQNLYDEFSNDPRLSKFVPTFTDPDVTIGRLDNAAGRWVTVEPVLDFSDVSGIAQDATDDCFANVRRRLDSIINNLDNQLAEQIAVVDRQFDDELGVIEADVLSLTNTANGDYNTRKQEIFNQYSRILSESNQAFSNGAVTQTELFYLIILDKVVYALNIRTSRDLLQAELAQLDQALATATENLNARRDAVLEPLREEYNTKKTAAQVQAEEAYLVCHNQGAFTGG